MEAFSLPCLKKGGFSSGSETKIGKKKKSVEIRVFHPPLCLFQSTWTPEPMQETAWSSGGRAAGGQPTVSLWVAMDRSVHLQEKLWTSVTPDSVAMHQNRENPSISVLQLRDFLCRCQALCFVVLDTGGLLLSSLCEPCWKKVEGPYLS